MLRVPCILGAGSRIQIPSNSQLELICVLEFIHKHVWPIVVTTWGIDKLAVKGHCWLQCCRTEVSHAKCHTPAMEHAWVKGHHIFKGSMWAFFLLGVSTNVYWITLYDVLRHTMEFDMSIFTSQYDSQSSTPPPRSCNQPTEEIFGQEAIATSPELAMDRN